MPKEPRLITPREVAEYLTTGTDSASLLIIEPKIDMAQAQTLGYIKARTFAERKDITITRKHLDVWQSIIDVPDGLIMKVNSFMVDDQVLDIGAGTFDDSGDIIIRPWTVQFERRDFNRNRWSQHRVKVTMNYDRGYNINTVPYDLRQALI